MAYSLKTLQALSNEALDRLYFKKYGRRAYHMSREGYINSLTRTLNITWQRQ